MSLLEVAKIIYDFLAKFKAVLNALNITALDESIDNAMKELK